MYGVVGHVIDGGVHWVVDIVAARAVVVVSGAAVITVAEVAADGVVGADEAEGELAEPSGSRGDEVTVSLALE